MGSLHRNHLTIGYLTPSLGDGVSRTLWSGVADAARAHQAKLVTLVGGRLGDAVDPDNPSPALYHLANAVQLDGLVSWASAIGGALPRAKLVHFHRQFRAIPLVSLNVPMPGVPTVSVDSARGMHDLMSHLIDLHGYRRLAFLRGPAHHAAARERHATYADVLETRGIGVDPALISLPGAFDEATGAAGICVLLDERRLRPGKDFDAVVTASDALALGALYELQRRGVCVPDDVALVGFNDGPEGHSAATSLTSVALPFHEQGYRAVETLVAWVSDAPYPAFTSVVPRLIVRRSCGCRLPAVTEAAAAPLRLEQGGTSTGPDVIMPDPADLAGAIAAAAAPFAPEFEHQGPELVSAFLDDLAEPANPFFLIALEHALRRTVDAGETVGDWQYLVSSFRCALLPYLATEPQMLLRAEDLWHQARVFIGDAAVRAQAHRASAARRRTSTLHDLGRALTTVDGLPDLLDALADRLPDLGITTCYLALYADPEAPRLKDARLHLAMDREGRRNLGSDGEPLADHQGLPTGLSPDDGPHRVVEALTSGSEALGFVVFGLGPTDVYVYDLLAQEIGNAVKRAILLTRSTRLFEASRKAQWTAEEANRLKSRFLSTVSHELRLPLSLLVGLSEMLLQEQAHGELHLPAPYRQDLARIHVSSRQLDSLIGDVLDLTQSHMGQLKLIQAPLPLHDVVSAAALVGEQMAQEKGLVWRTQLPARLPWVLGDRARLQQVLLNLINNAVKFTTAGEIVLEVRVEDDQAIVMIRDTGLGVPAGEQMVIFDEFRQSERTTARGYGGLGLGLALCRTLVEMHGGEIGVRSSGIENAGSTFYFTLPTINPVTLDSTPAPQEDAVLILTERQDGAATLAASLRHKGIPVRVATIEGDNGWFRALAAAPPALIILDAEPASTRGWALMEELKQHPRTARVPVLFCKLISDRCGGSLISIDQLTKPLRSDTLLAALHRHGLGLPDAAHPQTILVVDDDPAVLEAQVRMMSIQLPTSRVVTAANGREALAQIECLQPDLVLLDLRMPEVSGFDVLDAMWAHPSMCHIPVIILTGQVLTCEDIARLQRRVATILSKGVFSTEEIVAHIESALTSSRQLNRETQGLMHQAMAFIHEHYPEPISRKEIAEYVNLSETYLSTCFREELGIPPIVYLNRYRIWQAKRLLTITDSTISDVACDVGFSSASYFGRVFHREVGVSPTAYRRGEARLTDHRV